jgi:guanylate kinase
VRDGKRSGHLYHQEKTLAGILFIISAPSGSGKSTLVSKLRSLVTDIDFSVSYTTRAPRGLEQPGREYNYISRATFEEMIDRGEFLEHASVFSNYYGTAYRSLKDAGAAGKDLLLDIDVQGAAQVRKKISDAVSIFVLPPNPEELKARLRHRSIAEGKLDEDEIARRLTKARGEIENYRQYPYILVNDVLVYAVESLKAIVISERATRRGTPPDPETVRMMQLADKCRLANSTDRLEPVLASFGLLDMHATPA